MSSYDTTTEENDPIADAIFNGGNISPAPEVDSGADVESNSGADVAIEDELLLGKFKTPEDMATAYQNLEREFTQARQRATDLESLLEDEPDAVVHQVGHDNHLARRDDCNAGRVKEARGRARAVSKGGAAITGKCRDGAEGRHEPDAVVLVVSNN
jgi:hypothetical protein